MITLTNPVIVRPAITATSAYVSEIFENPIEKTVSVDVVFSTNPYIARRILVWKGASYDAAGQWTDSSLNAAVKAIIEAPGFTI